MDFNASELVLPDLSLPRPAGEGLPDVEALIQLIDVVMRRNAAIVANVRQQVRAMAEAETSDIDPDRLADAWHAQFCQPLLDTDPGLGGTFSEMLDEFSDALDQVAAVLSDWTPTAARVTALVEQQDALRDELDKGFYYIAEAAMHRRH